MKKFISLTLILATITLASTAFAADVYVTKRGKRYHKADCKVIQNKETQKIDQADAEKKNLKPCGICFKSDAGASLPKQDRTKAVSMK